MVGMLATSALPLVTNAEDWNVQVAVLDDATGTGFDLASYTITIRVTDERGSQVLTGSTSDGVVSLIEDEDDVESIISWVFRASTMAGLSAGTYIVAVTIANGSETVQMILGRLPVLEGGFA